MLTRALRAAVALALCACAAQPAAPLDVGTQPDDVQSFEEFRDSVTRETFEGGGYVVDGDIAIPNERLLRELYRARVGVAGGLIVHQASGQDAAWSDAQAHALRYCVSTSFGARYDEVVAAMDAAAGAWEAAADVDFVHATEHDGACGASTDGVVFDVRPVSGQRYLARAFFPNYARGSRNLLIDGSSFTTTTPGLTLVGILRHELGHALGFRHEHTRPESGRCYEDSSWRALTDYDRASVMHYPHCNGTGTWELALTARDEQGAAALYGPPASDPPPPPPANGASNRVFVDAGESRLVGPFAVTPGTGFVALTRGLLGNVDLYVRFDALPEVGGAYDCRPLSDGGDEECDLDVPVGARLAYVVVHGATIAAAEVEIGYTGSAAGPTVDDVGAILALAGSASLTELDDDIALDRRAATNIVADRPFATFADLDAVSYVGPSALRLLHLAANARDDDSLVLEVANTASFEALDVDVGLDRRAAQNIVDTRPFATIEQLDAVPYVGPTALEALRVWATGGSEPPPPPAPADDAAILHVANTATLLELDVDAALDARAARNIVDLRPFATIAELDAVPFVGPSALDALAVYAAR